MNNSITDYEELMAEFSGEAIAERKSKKTSTSSEAPRRFGKRRKSPQQFNGIHRRRRKQIRW